MATRTKRELFILLALITLVTLLWFRHGALIAGGEGSLNVFNYVRWQDKISPWQKMGTGLPVPFYVSFLPAVMFNEVLSATGLPYFAIQALFFFFIFCSGIFGMYFLAKKMFGGIQTFRFVPVLAAVFYFLNLFSLSQIFNRNLMLGFFLWAYLPVFLYMWMGIMESVSVKKVLVFAVVSFMYATSFLHPSGILTIWVAAGLWTLVEIVKHKKRWKRILLSALIAFALWVCANLWLLVPFYQLVTDATASVNNYDYNLDLVDGLSTYFQNDQIFTLRQKAAFGPSSHLFAFYQHPFVMGLSIAIFAVVIYSLIRLYKGKFGKHIIILFAAGWGISKGTNPPLGYLFYSLLFRYLPPSTVLRNSYEKFGVVWVLSYGLLFALGVNYFLVSAKKKLIKTMVVVYFVVSTAGLCWPIITGKVYADYTYVKVPEYYQKANNFVNLDPGLYKILMLPIYKNDSVRYTWNLWSIEPTEHMFDKPTFSRPIVGPSQKLYSELYEKFNAALPYDYLLDAQNIKYLILRKDIDTTYGDPLPIAQVESILERNDKVKQIASIGELVIYEYDSTANGLFEAKGATLPEISFERVGTLKYKVHVQNSQESFRIVFKETYNKLWTAEIDGKKISTHDFEYGYANQWEIDKGGSFDIDIYLDVWLWKDIL